MDADWDLQAVVRGCCSAVTSSSSATGTTATSAAAATVGPPDGGNQQKSTFSAGVFPDLFHPTSDNTIQQLMNNLYNYNRLRSQNLQPPAPPPTTPAAPPQSHPISAFSFLGGLQDPPLYNHHHHHHQKQQQQQQEKQFQIKQQSLGVSRCTTAHAQSTIKIKKRKNQIKKVCQVPAEGSSPDLWSWRKYGQKPIKGSPYPRGYYKCSTLKGCSARKQVERNRSDPGMLIITYTGEHTHPVPTQLNSLSGTTRNKTTTTTAGDDGGTGSKPTPSPPISPASTAPPATEKMDETERDDTDDDNNFDVSGLVIDEDAFDGLDEIVDGSVVGDVFSDHHAAATTASPPLPWLSSNWSPQPPPLPAGVDF